MSHYFTDNRHLEKNRKEFTFRFWCFNYSLVSDDGVFAKDSVDYGTRFLMDTVLKADTIGRSILDIGCGYGVVGIVMKKQFPSSEVTMVDVNPRALELASENAIKNDVDVIIKESYLYDELQGITYTDILSNPPIHAGKEVIYSIFEEAYNHLEADGNLWVVIRKQHGADSAKKKIKEIFGNCEMVDRDKGFQILLAKKS